MFKEYQSQAKRTCPSLGEKLDLPHMVLGMNTEIVELEDAIKVRDFVNVSEELADIHWYLANYCTFRKKELSNFSEAEIRYQDVTVEALYPLVAELQDLVKKYIAYSKPIPEPKEIELLMRISFVLGGLYTRYNLSLEKSLENNIEKLRVRFPEKFSEENAVNRNLVEERKTLEK